MHSSQNAIRMVILTEGFLQPGEAWHPPHGESE